LAQGEFSIVYRVSKPTAMAFVGKRQTAPGPDQSWAVKKSKKPYQGLRDRESKLKEVQVLRELQGQQHILEYFDCWEANNHLYIQTEYCDNGSLSKFLAEAGFKARLDDFRIWKILLEVSMVTSSP